jgi:hypothetical protein
VNDKESLMEVAAYDYTDEQGQLLFQVVRYHPKAFRQRRPNGKGGWIWNLQGVRRVLYRLPELLGADPTRPVFVVEGEKDSNALAALGLVTTTNPGGASKGKWRPEYNEPLHGRHVVILPDNDKVGHKHADQVAQSLHGIAESVLVVNLPGLPDKGDVSDWLQTPGHDKEALLKLVDAAVHQAPQVNDEPAGQPEPDAGSASDPAADPQPETQAQALVQSAAPATFFHAPDGAAYVAVPVTDGHAPDGARLTLPVRSRPFRQWLGRCFYQSTGKPARSQMLADALAHFEAQARFDGPCLAVHCRVGTTPDGGIGLDLGCATGQAVQITPHGWTIVARPPVHFRRAPSMLPLPVPVHGGSIEELRPFVNVRAEDWQLVVAWLLAALRPRGPYPLLVLHGQQGSAKSTTARVLRALVDPNSAPLRCAPRDERDLMLMATNSWVVALDNLSWLPPWLSDALCRLSTGGGLSTRELYTDADEVVFDAQRPVILTGIEELATRSDLLDRAIPLHLPAIGEDDCRTEADFRAEFEKARPRILGALLDAVAGALCQLPSVQLPRRPRMADFATWVTAAEPALGWPKGAFLDAYTGNRDAADQLALEASPLYQPLCKLLDECGQWKGTATDLLDELATRVPESVPRSPSWPRAPHVLTGRLRRLAPNLRRAGIQIEDGRAGTRKGDRWISLTLLPPPAHQASAASEPSDVSPAEGCSDASAADPDASGIPADAPPPAQTPHQESPADAPDAPDAPSPTDDSEYL